MKGQKLPTNSFWDGLGLHLGGVWDALGSLLGTLGRLLAVLGAFKIQLLQTIGSRWAPKFLLDRFWVDLGRAWGGSGRVWERLGEGFGRF